MNRIPTILATLSLLLCVGIAVAAGRSRSVHSEQLALLEARIATLQHEASTMSSAPEQAERSERLDEELLELSARLERLESKRGRTPLEAVRPKAPATASTPEPDARPGAAAGARRSATPKEHAEFAGLLEAMLKGGFVLEDTAEAERFWDLARGTDVVDAAIADLEERLRLSPHDTELRMELADGYIAKLATVPGGPEQGLWGMKAEEQWREVLARDPEHWKAQFSLADGWSHYPDFMGKTGDAIAGLERAREIQEVLLPTPEHVQTYLSLARMYLRSGKHDRALETLEAGLGFHPGNEDLLHAIQELR